MTKNRYVFKTATNSDPIDISWNEAQEWCNFVLFKPTHLPEGLIETSNTIRPESSGEESSHRTEFNDENRSLSIKQFLYDWAPPAYDHPCLWRNTKISAPENTPLPRAHLVGNNYLWFGLDYRRKPAATINMLRTQIEITTLHGTFDDQEIMQIVSAMVPIDSKVKDLILATSFAELMFYARHQIPTSDVLTSYFKHTRSKAFQCYPHDATFLEIVPLGHWLMHTAIKDYRLDSVFLFGQDPQNIQEVEYYFESLIEPGSYIRFLVTHKDAEYSIQYPSKLGDQACHSALHQLKDGHDLHHAWSKTNENGCHSLVFQTKNETINCIVKPAPWTTAYWAVELCQNALIQSETIEWAMTALQQSEINTAVVVETPWSNVLKISTPQGSVYLKQTPSDLFVEVEVINKCRELCGIADIPEVIAASKDLHCFLMKECGDASLRTVFDGQINVDLLVQGLQIYTKMQKATAPHVDAFLQSGVPDWRLECFPKLYQDLVSNKEFLKAHGLETAQIKILQNAVRKVETLCQELSNYGIPECLNHSDFHENNMLFSRTTKKVSIIDLGETAINHPLFSLAAFLKIPCGRYNVALGSTDYQKLHEACFNEWLLSGENLQAALVVTEKLLPVYLLFAQKRFLDAIDLPYNADNPMSVKQHDKINKGLVWLIDNMRAEL